jgi:hypothetical protein
MRLVVRTEGEPLALAAAVRRELAEIDRDLPVAAVSTVDRYLLESMAGPRLAAIDPVATLRDE